MKKRGRKKQGKEKSELRSQAPIVFDGAYELMEREEKKKGKGGGISLVQKLLPAEFRLPVDLVCRSSSSWEQWILKVFYLVPGCLWR